ncbi:hypothetical protein BDQ17DRAFT_1367288 [Cyathus striatus]|nr:hypothetical protein BDQ17DRAFT_1367288 [Cyathus striatus]
MHLHQVPTSILSFPVEIFDDITKQISSLPTLRLVCKRFNDVVVPQMFSSASISLRAVGLDGFLELLESLAVGNHPAVLHAKSLAIRDVVPSQEPKPRYGQRPTKNEVEKDKLQHKSHVLDPYYSNSDLIKDRLSRAISRLQQVATVTWYIDYRKSDEWSRNCVISGIAQMPSLTSFILEADLDKKTSVQLHSLPPLKVFEIHTMSSNTSVSWIQGVKQILSSSSDQLIRLAIKSRNEKDLDTPYLHSLLQDASSSMHLTHLDLEGFAVQLNNAVIPHLRSLQSLHLKKIYKRAGRFPLLTDPKSSTGDIWAILKREKIYIREINLDEPTECFVEYLRSYAGLKSLTIKYAIGTDEAHSDNIALDFYRHALYNHAKSLETLETPLHYEGEWRFGEHTNQILSNLINLKQLAVAVVGVSTQTVPILGGHSENPNIVTECTYDPLHPVCMLMQTASLLPKLDILSIYGASIASNRHVWCGNGIVSHAIAMTKQIDTHVTMIGPLDPLKYGFKVRSSGRYYELQQCKESGEFWYCIA